MAKLSSENSSVAPASTKKEAIRKLADALKVIALKFSSMRLHMISTSSFSRKSRSCSTSCQALELAFLVSLLTACLKVAAALVPLWQVASTLQKLTGPLLSSPVLVLHHLSPWPLPRKASRLASVPEMLRFQSSAALYTTASDRSNSSGHCSSGRWCLASARELHHSSLPAWERAISCSKGGNAFGCLKVQEAASLGIREISMSRQA